MNQGTAGDDLVFFIQKDHVPNVFQAIELGKEGVFISIDDFELLVQLTNQDVKIAIRCISPLKFQQSLVFNKLLYGEVVTGF